MTGRAMKVDAGYIRRRSIVNPVSARMSVMATRTDPKLNGLYTENSMRPNDNIQHTYDDRSRVLTMQGKLRLYSYQTTVKAPAHDIPCQAGLSRPLLSLRPI